MLTTDDLRTLSAVQIRELRAEAARERLARLFIGSGSGGRGLRHTVGRAVVAFGLIVEGDGAAGAVTAPSSAAAAGLNPCDDDLVLRRAA